MHPTERHFDWIVTALALITAIIVFREAATSLAAQDAASGGPMRNAALFPRAVAWSLTGLVAINAMHLLRRGRATQPAPPDVRGGADTTPKTDRALVATAAFVGYLLALPVAGYYAATPVLMAGLMFLLGVGTIRSVVSAALLTLAVAWIFEGLLNVVLPLGLSKFTLFG